MFLILNKSQKYFIERQKELGNINGYIEEIIEGQKVVKVFSHEAIACEEFEYLNENTNSKDVVLYTSFADGGYAEYTGFKSYIDARAEVFLEKNNKSSVTIATSCSPLFKYIQAA